MPYAVLALALLIAWPCAAQEPEDGGPGQLIRVDSVLYVNEAPALSFPFAAQRDSLRAVLEAECDSALAVDSLAAFLDECHWPTYFHEPRLDARLVDVPGGWVGAQAAFRRELPLGFRAVVTLGVAWDGTVQEVWLRSYQGDLSQVDLAALVRRLRFGPIGQMSVPTLERALVTVPLQGAAVGQR